MPEHPRLLVQLESRPELLHHLGRGQLGLSCEGGTAVGIANPVRPEPMRTPMAQVHTFGPKSGAQIAADFCAAARRVGGIQLPQAGETQATRKVSYLLAAEGTPYVVGAGLYDDKAKVEDLDRLAGGEQ